MTQYAALQKQEPSAVNLSPSPCSSARRRWCLGLLLLCAALLWAGPGRLFQIRGRGCPHHGRRRPPGRRL